MTHPFHPLHGHEFELVETMAVMGVEWVHYTGDDETLRTIRQAWTSVAAEDPFVRVAGLNANMPGDATGKRGASVTSWPSSLATGESGSHRAMRSDHGPIAMTSASAAISVP